MIYGCRRGEECIKAMVTYDNLFSFVIMICAIISLIVMIIKHKK